MNLQTLMGSMTGKLQDFLFTGIAVLFIAIVFEFIAWWAGRRIEKLTSPLINVDRDRESSWRIKRRTLLRQTPKLISRTLCYTVALILVFDRFGVPVLPLSLAIGAVALLFGAALIPQMRDMAQGYSLLSEDALALGDAVDINGHQGIVEKFTLRGVWLRDTQGRMHCIANREISSLVVHARRTEKNTEKPNELPELAPRNGQLNAAATATAQNGAKSVKAAK